MILLICIALGLALRRAGLGPVRSLQHVRLHAEPLLLLMLVTQALLPLIRLTGDSARVAFVIWTATFPLLIGVAWANRRHPGLPVMAVGLVLNLVVILANRGMPVSLEAVRAAVGAVQGASIPVGDFVHVLATSATRLPWLADVLPIPGPRVVASVASAGDCLLFAGVVTFLAAASRDVVRAQDERISRRMGSGVE